MKAGARGSASTARPTSDQETATPQVHHAHQRIIDAVRNRDVEELIAASDEHRAATERLVIQRLGRSRPRSPAW